MNPGVHDDLMVGQEEAEFECRLSGFAHDNRHAQRVTGRVTSHTERADASFPALPAITGLGFAGNL